MCGITGFLRHAPEAPFVEAEALLKIRDSMTPRGPDSAGLWIDATRRVGLAHRRLSILDLSVAGHQPMQLSLASARQTAPLGLGTPDEDQALVIAFNGEIYNFQALRQQLQREGCTFRSTSDTEVLLHLYRLRGPRMVDALRGMFAFAIWDPKASALFLARDPFGIKPLYYSDSQGVFRFASQVKALAAADGVDLSPDPAGHVSFLLWGSVSPPHTLYRGVRELLAGHTLMVTREGCGVPQSYLDLTQELAQARIAALEQPEPTADERLDRLRHALRDSLRHHMVSDVEVSLFLSAGLDSNLLLGLLADCDLPAPRAITLAFEEFRGQPQDESGWAARMAERYGARHHIRWVRGEAFAQDLPAVLHAMDQPTIDGVNTYYVSKATAEQGLKVALSGLGADELFGGYETFREIPALNRRIKPIGWVPGLGRGFRWVSAPLLKRLASPKYASLLELGSTLEGAYLLRRGLFMPWEIPGLIDPDLAREGWRQLQPIASLRERTGPLRASPHTQISALETQVYMRQQLLRDSDWAGMAHSLEIRVPFVDLELLRAVAPLMARNPPPSKRDAAATLSRPLPPEFVNRPKTGFNIPVRDWLAADLPNAAKHRGLRPWALYLYDRFAQAAPAGRR